MERLKELAEFSSATVHEAIGRRGAMDSGIKPIARGMRVCGPAFTVECPPADNLTIHAAIEMAAAGDILVIDCGDYLEAGPFGDILAAACQSRGVAGLIVNGSVRDTASIAAMNFAVFSRGVSIKGTSKGLLGKIGETIDCGGTAVSRGDIVVADDDGVVVIPAAELEQTIVAARKHSEREAALRERIRDGASTVDLLGLRDRLDRLRGNG